MPEPKVYITEDAETGLSAALTALESGVDLLITKLATVRDSVLATVASNVESATNTQNGVWNTQAAVTDQYGTEQQTRLNTAYDDPDEDLETLSSRAYSESKPIFRSSKRNQAQSYRKHVAQSRFFAHDGLFLDPAARVFPWHNSIKNQQKFALQETLEEANWTNFFSNSDPDDTE